MDLINLQNKDSQKLIKDLILRPLRVNQDETGGVLVETLRRDWEDVYGDDRAFAMQYFSITPTGLARDEHQWHLHHQQEDRFLVVGGEIVVAVADYRKDSETFGLLNLFHMKTIDNPYLILIPKGTLHGFLVVGDSDATLLNFPTQVYNPEDELRVPHEEANIKTPSGEFFTWNMVREKFPSLKKQ